MTELKEQVELALGDIRPALQADGGDIELVDVKDGVCLLYTSDAADE